MFDDNGAAERLRRIPALWFSFKQPVRRAEYAISGVSLAAIKFLIDSGIYRAGVGESWSWTQYVDPSYVSRFSEVPDDSDRVVLWLALVTIPFVWIGISMTVRRALDARLPWGVALVFFVPVINYFLMVALCLLPSRRAETRPPPPRGALRIADGLASVAVGSAVGLLTLLASVAWLGEYGVGLFLGAPYAIGFSSVVMSSRRGLGSVGRSILVAQGALIATGLSILLFALEGVLCLAMAYPPAAVLATLGALGGHGVASLGRSRRRTAIGMLAVIPILLAADAANDDLPRYVVHSVIEIDAPPEQVWPHVVGFAEMPAPRDRLFRTGIAYPIRARIEGVGVGAVRYCEFSTGAFVEPITTWDEPRHLAFDVAENPPSMDELSPFEEVFAPHLVDGLIARRGEFRLVERPGGRTRLEGRTWYTLDLAPAAYWTLWSDHVIRRIHLRVLRHIQRLAEERTAAAGSDRDRRPDRVRVDPSDGAAGQRTPQRGSVTVLPLPNVPSPQTLTARVK